MIFPFGDFDVCPYDTMLTEADPVVFVKGDDSVFPHLVDLLSHNETLIERMRDRLVVWTISGIVGFANISRSFWVW